MRAVLPSTTALRVFEAAARHLTCTGAADELFLTQSAVSKQIRTLEESLGVQLFVRVNRGLVLTELGRSYLDEIRPLLSQLAQASARLAARRTSHTTLTLRILAILGDRWLLPRYAAFAQANPLIEVQFTSLMSRDGTGSADADGEFRFGEGVWPGFVADYLFGKEMLLVASPTLFDGKPIRRISDLAQFAQLHHFQVPQAWSEFADDQGMPLLETPRVIRYEFYSTMLKSAAAGMGLALVPAVLVQEELMRGELVNPLALHCTSRYGYYFVIHEHKQHEPALATFRSWLQDEAQRTPRGVSGMQGSSSLGQLAA